MLTRVCNHCNIEHPLDQLVKDASGLYGRKRQCKACLCALNTARIQEDRNRHNETRRLKKHADPRSALLSSARERAKQGGLPFDLDVVDLVIPVLCPALGIPLEVNTWKVGYNSITLDKIVPELGYVRGNIVVVSHLANRIKSNATIAQLRAVADFYSKL